MILGYLHNNIIVFDRTLTVNGWSATELSLSALRKFTRYEVRVRAFNAVAAGPASAPVSATTLEGGKNPNIAYNTASLCRLKTQYTSKHSNDNFDNLYNDIKNRSNCKFFVNYPVLIFNFASVPESHPMRVSCSPLSSSGIKVLWNPPPIGQHGGLIQGYKVIYLPISSDHGKMFHSSCR